MMPFLDRRTSLQGPGALVVTVSLPGPAAPTGKVELRTGAHAALHADPGPGRPGLRRACRS